MNEAKDRLILIQKATKIAELMKSGDFETNKKNQEAAEKLLKEITNSTDPITAKAVLKTVATLAPKEFETSSTIVAKVMRQEYYDRPAEGIENPQRPEVSKNESIRTIFSAEERISAYHQAREISDLINSDDFATNLEKQKEAKNKFLEIVKKYDGNEILYALLVDIKERSHAKFESSEIGLIKAIEAELIDLKKVKALEKEVPIKEGTENEITLRTSVAKLISEINGGGNRVKINILISNIYFNSGEDSHAIYEFIVSKCSEKLKEEGFTDVKSSLDL